MSWAWATFSTRYRNRAENRAFWAQQFGLPEDADPTKWGAPFQAKLCSDLRLFGFNTLGCHTELIDLPLFNGDSSYSVPDEMMPHPNGPHCVDQVERARMSDEFARRAFARPEFVGWNWCGWMDSWKTHPGQEIRQHSGLQDPFGRHYGPMVEAFSRFSDEMYGAAQVEKDYVQPFSK